MVWGRVLLVKGCLLGRDRSPWQGEEETGGPHSELVADGGRWRSVSPGLQGAGLQVVGMQVAGSNPFACPGGDPRGE